VGLANTEISGEAPSLAPASSAVIRLLGDADHPPQ